MEKQERARAMIKRLREKESTYNRELLDEAADTIEALLEELAKTEGCDTCKYFLVPVEAEPCSICFGHRNWRWEGSE